MHRRITGLKPLQQHMVQRMDINSFDYIILITLFELVSGYY